jgi:hypothetical protein
MHSGGIFLAIHERVKEKINILNFNECAYLSASKRAVCFGNVCNARIPL